MSVAVLGVNRDAFEMKMDELDLQVMPVWLLSLDALRLDVGDVTKLARRLLGRGEEDEDARLLFL
jgi:hypothetical protein